MHRQGYSHVAGVDEVGCGCWAGPVFAGAVILPLGVHLSHVRDSKLLSTSQRERLSEKIMHKAVAWAIGLASENEIDTLNIRRASGLAMQRAVTALTIQPEAVLSDAFVVPSLDVPCKNVIRGDQMIVSVAAASIIAKVARDAYMKKMALLYPVYGFETHKGYGTRQHQEALTVHGACPIHRQSYRPVAIRVSSRG